MGAVMINGCLMEVQCNFCKIMFYAVPQDSKERPFSSAVSASPVNES